MPTIHMRCTGVGLLTHDEQTENALFSVLGEHASDGALPTNSYYSTDRQTDILLTEKKSHYRLICHRNERDICTCIYKIVNLLKSYVNIHGMTYTTKIILSGIAKIKTGYFDNINDYY